MNIQDEVKKHNENGMNNLKEKNFIGAYKSFNEALTIYEDEIMKNSQNNEEYKVQFLNFSQMSATMLILEFKTNNNQEHLDKAIEILDRSIDICLLYKVKYDIYLLTTLLCDCYELQHNYKEIEKLHVSNINYLKENYNPGHAQEYAKNYSTLYYNQSLLVMTEEKKDLILYYSRISIILLIEIYKITQDKNIFAHFIDRETLRSVNFTEEEIDDTLKLFDDGKVTEITLNYNK
jgi:tetratricopeptide (TPR) repeat protein